MQRKHKHRVIKWGLGILISSVVILFLLILKLEQTSLANTWTEQNVKLVLQEEEDMMYLQWTDLKKKHGLEYYYDLYEGNQEVGEYSTVENGLQGNQYSIDFSPEVVQRYYKVRPYKVVKGKKIYGNESNICVYQKKIDLIIFMGQSNMSGRGENLGLAPTVAEHTAYEFRAITDPTRLYHLEEPFGKYENVLGAIDDVSNNSKVEVKSGGMVASFCNAYYSQTKVPIVAVSASKSGLSIKLLQPGEPVLEDAINRLETSKNWLKENGYGIRHIYMVFCQGESNYKSSGANYINYVKNMIEEMRKHGVEMCFIVGTGNHSLYPDIYEGIQNAQLTLCYSYEYALMTTTLAETFVEQGLMGENAHYSQEGYNRLGQDAGLVAGKYVAGLEK